MSVERNKNGNIIIKGNSGVTSIQRIETDSDDKHEEKFQQWVNDCAKLVTICNHTFKETEQYFLENCDALPLDLNDIHMKNFKCNVILIHYKDKLAHHPSEFLFDMTDEEIEKWYIEQNAMREEAMNSSSERFGLILRGYYLAHTERNAVLYEKIYLETQKSAIRHNHDAKQIKMQNIYFFFEETTEHCQASGGGQSLIDQMIVFRGITEEDIQKRSPRFLGYISTLRDMGNLPGF